MKAWKILIVCIGIALTAVPLSLVFAAGAPSEPDFVGYKYYYWTLPPYPEDGDCTFTPDQYVDVINFKAGLVSSTPSPYYIYAGYTEQPYWGANGDAWLLTAPGWGPSSGSGSWYGMWGNHGNVAETGTGVTMVLWP